jgi:hypothetical protein
MSYSSEQGYVPATIEAIMLSVMNGVNTQFGLSYTQETFIGTNLYKHYYALVQRLQENEVKTSEIFLKLQDYFAITNEQISRPVNTNQGLVDVLESNGYIASVKKPIDADAGKVFICVDVDDSEDDYEDTKLAIATIIKNSTVAGIVSQGTEVTAIVLSNGQSFDFKYNLPDAQETHLKLTVTTSENNQSVILTPEEVKDILLDNIAARYRLGKNFEPQKYFSLIDAPYASAVKLEYSLDAGATWLTTIFDAEYDDKLTFDLANVTLIED